MTPGVPEIIHAYMYAYVCMWDALLSSLLDRTPPVPSLSTSLPFTVNAVLVVRSITICRVLQILDILFFFPQLMV